MKILLTNDDGINAPGLEVLEHIARELSDDIWVVAPELEQSGKGRAISLTEFVRVRELAPQRYAVNGTPSDCVLLALDELMPERPDFILSGVNAGQNIAEDTTFSGTIAAAPFEMIRRRLQRQLHSRHLLGKNTRFHIRNQKLTWSALVGF